MRRPCAALLALLFCTLLLAPPAAAARARSGPAGRSAGAVEAALGLARLWETLFLQLFGLGRLAPHRPGAGSSGSAGEKIGCRMDPDGLCLPAEASADPNSEIGCSADPNGLCLPAASSAGPNSEIGCSMDPDGLCKPR